MAFHLELEVGMGIFGEGFAIALFIAAIPFDNGQFPCVCALGVVLEVGNGANIDQIATMSSIIFSALHST